MSYLDKTQRFILICLALVNCGELTGQSNDCRTLLKTYVQDMGAIDIPAPGTTYFIDMVTTAAPRGTGQPVSSRMKTYIMHDQIIYESPSVTIFQDVTEMYVVMHEVNKILIEDSSLKDSVSYKKDQMLGFQLGVVENSTILRCEEVKLGGDKSHKIILKPDTELEDRFKLSRCIIYLSQKTGWVKRVRVYYGDDHPVDYQDVKYNVMDFNHKSSQRAPSARSYLFDETGKIQESYIGYELIDNRR